MALSNSRGPGDVAAAAADHSGARGRSGGTALLSELDVRKRGDMKKLLALLVLLLALNFLAALVGVGWLWRSGHLDRQRALAIKELLFPTPPPAVQLQTAEADPTTQPTVKLDELLARQSGRTASEQVEFIQRTFDAQMALLDRRQRELLDLQRQVDLAKEQIQRDRVQVDDDRKALAAREQEAARLQTDQGFQDSLALYQTMAAKQVKTIFMTLDEQAILHYLQAMQPRNAAKIIKEFKTPEETERIQRVLERMRLAAAPQESDQSPQQASAKGNP